MAAKILAILRRPELAKPIRKLQMRTLTSFAEALGAVASDGLEFVNALSEREGDRGQDRDGPPRATTTTTTGQKPRDSNETIEGSPPVERAT